MKNQTFAIIVMLCAGFGTVLTSYFSNSIEIGQGFGVGIIFCFLLWILFKYDAVCEKVGEKQCKISTIIGIILIITMIIVWGIDNLTNQSEDLEFNWTPTQDAERSDFANESDWNEYIEMRYYQLLKERNDYYASQENNEGVENE